MRERPILFSTLMVQAILRGEKTQTRRILNPQPPESVTDIINICNEFVSAYPNRKAIKSFEFTVKSKYLIGDQLWVRETFAPEFFPDGKPLYKADWNNIDSVLIPEPKWKPSIFMPRKLSRIQLEITDVRVEGVQEITEEDAMAEGMRIPCMKSNDGRSAIPLVQISGKYLPKDYGDPYKYKSLYAALWDELNKKRGYGWERNPWVWATTFRRIK